MRRASVVALRAIAVVGVLLAAGCKEGRTRISSILNRPEEFRDRDVIIGGVVTKTNGADLVVTEAGAYQVDDGTGKIWVLTKNGLPERGQQVALKGTVAGGLRLGGESLGAVLREIERRRP